MEKREKRLWIRVSEQEHRRICAKANAYGSVSAMVRDAIARLEPVPKTAKFEIIRELTQQCHTIENGLSWAGSNLNQLTRRANEARVAGIIPAVFFTEILLPELRSIRNDVGKIKETLVETAKMVLNGKGE